MNDTEAASHNNLVFPIKYESFAGSEYNLDFRGKGALTVRPEEPHYVFSGVKRQSFSFAREHALDFESGSIWNVTLQGCKIRFSTGVGESGRRMKSFFFIGRSEEEAAIIAGLLPRRMDADFIAAQQFATQVNSLAAGDKPWNNVTNLIIGANVIVFLFMAIVLGTGWFGVTDLLPYVRYGANNGAATTDGQWWRLVTCMFMHYGLLHLSLNQWALYQAGHFLEKVLGRSQYLLVYFGSGIMAGLASIIWSGDKVWSAGASGAIFGVYGAILGYMLREKDAIPRSVFKPMMRSTLAFAGYNLFYGFIIPQIDNAAHIGGLLGGALLGWLIAVPVDKQLREKLVIKRSAQSAAALVSLCILGYVLCPRFDYRVADELAWQDAVKASAEKETSLISREKKAVEEYGKTQQGAALDQLLRTELIPFYEDWLGRISRLALKPQRATARHRDHLKTIIRMKRESLLHLQEGLRENRPDALERYSSENQAISREIRKFSGETP